MPDTQLNQQIAAIERLAVQWAVAELSAAIIATLLFFALLYLTIRYAIRDGLRDARGGRPAERSRPVDTSALPDMRAD